MALSGLATRRIRYAGLLVGFCVVRTAIITDIQFPEPRYVLECFPAVMVLAGAAWDWCRSRRQLAES
jgi:hypothetical protein